MAIAVGVVLLAALGSCAPGGPAHLMSLAAACALAWPAALWVASACGTGRWLATRCGWSALQSWPAAAATGTCALAAIDAAAGWMGLLSGDWSQMWAVALLLPGIALLARDLAAQRARAPVARGAADRAGVLLHAVRPWWFRLSIAMAIPALVVAAASEPGVLWSTEFGAYDALSYHLTLPQEWHAGDGIATLGHCAYSGMPSWMEAAYLHMLALGGGHAIGGSSWFVSAQMLHAALAVVAALCTGVAARMALGATATPPVRATADAVACVLVLGLPWLAVTGTLAYSESLMLCALAAALCVLMHGVSCEALARRDLIALTGLVVCAFGAKPSAALLVAAPLLVPAVLLWRERGARTRVIDALACIALATLLLVPWWVRNLVATGNLIFPFADALLGGNAWTADQSARFAAAHAAPPGLHAWIAPWQQWIAFGWGAAPVPGDAWRPLWSFLPALVTIATVWAIAAAVRARSVRTPQAICALIVVLQVIAWWTATHLQSRFLIPTAIPGAVLVACALAHLPRAGNSTVVAIALIVWSAQPAMAFLHDGPDPRAAALWVGAAHDLSGRRQHADDGPVHAPAAGTSSAEPRAAPANLVQAINALDPESARVASVGLSATAWVSPGIALDWCSVWDRGAVAQALAATGGDGQAAARLLAADGWTHVAIDQVMLDVWTRSGWIDPILTPEAIDGLRQGRRAAWTGRQGVLLSLEGEGTR
jgi:hypothetical protein